MGEVAVNHFSDWSHWHWMLWTLILIAAGGLSLVALSLANSGSEAERSHGDGFGWFAAAAGSALLAFIAFTGALINISRHLPGFKWAIFAVIVAVGVTAFAQFRVVEAEAGDRAHPWLWRSAAIATAVGGLIAIGYDGLNRVAAWIPTTIGVVLLGIFAAVLYASTPSRTR
ncbi:hypothetical protein [Rhodococcus sp. USK13]|uniref:hypothetical protein n=1 Tax=Rhodococcus sp. USK13 TaxID=2806442 RepID=UPI001BD08B81|nr:hypothetical protein [Rhodococcus sp. USK13]